MPTLNDDFDAFECLVRAEYLYNLQAHHGEFVRAACFGLSSLAGRALGFHVLLQDGTCFWRLPVSALCHKVGAPHLVLDHLQLWDCFSYDVAVTLFGHLSERRCRVFLKDGNDKAHPGEYVFTVDWYGSGPAEAGGDLGHKCAHLIALDNGCYALQPNNRVQFLDPAFVTPWKERPDYRTNTNTWKVENTPWLTEESSLYFYETEQENHVP